MPLDLAEVGAFVAVVETGGFRAAARRLAVSQPLISQQVQRLEQRLGASLIVRSRTRCVPTAEGARFLPHARALLETAQRALTVLTARRLVVGAASNPGIYLLPPYLSECEELRIGTNPDTVERLAGGAVDLAITEWWDGRQGFEVHAWRDEPMVGIVSPSHPFARAGPVPLARFLAEPLIGGEPGTGTGRLLAEALGQDASPLRIVRVMGSTEGVKRAVAAGLGVSVVLACAVRDEVTAGTLVAVPLSEPALRRRMLAVLPEGLPPTAPQRRFLARLGIA